MADADPGGLAGDRPVLLVGDGSTCGDQNTVFPAGKIAVIDDFRASPGHEHGCGIRAAEALDRTAPLVGKAAAGQKGDAIVNRGGNAATVG
jgi:hypothetical protein